MAGFGGSGSSNQSAAPPPPKILLAKPGLVTTAAGKYIRGTGGGGEDDSVSRSRLPPIGSLNLLSDSWEFNTDRFLPVCALSLFLSHPSPHLFSVQSY